MSDAVIAHWEVTRAKNAGQKDNPHGGQFDKWYVGLKNVDGGTDCEDAYWQRKSPSEVTVGDKVYGKVEEGDYGFRFYLEKEPDGNPGRSSGGGRAKEWKRESAFDPEKTARIGRAHAQHMGILTCAAMGLFESVSADQIERKLKSWIDFFENDVNQAGQKSLQASGNATPGVNERAATLPGSASSAPEQTSAVELRDIEMAVSSADSMQALSAEARAKVAEYMVSELNDEDRDRACNQLTNTADQLVQGQTLRAMQQRTENWIGEPLPEVTGGGEDDIPFARPEYRPLFSERERWRF